MNKNDFCVIMAGGIGSRFWPLSRTNKPKQFLDILGTGKPLLRQTFERFVQIIPPENIFIVTSAEYKDLVLEILPEIEVDQVLLEPLRRNTAPCIAYANYRIKTLNSKANIVVAPSDHLILKEREFIEVVSKGLKHVEENKVLLTLGINPNRIETGYGYIQVDGDTEKIELNNSYRKVKTFTEKPDYKMAKIFYESREFYWNSGIFFWSLPTIMNAFDKHLPEVNNLFNDGDEFYGTDKENSFIENIYPHCKNISIDYGILEKADNVDVLCSDFGWSDLGTWGSLLEHSEKDQKGNSIEGDNVLAYDLNDCIIRISDSKLAVIQGLKDYIIVESEGVLLICEKKDEQRIKNYVNDVRLQKGESFL